jgi:SAM-dependent methyltransferase
MLPSQIMIATDIPSPIDLRCIEDARDWESTAMIKRPWRSEFFEAFSKIMCSPSPRHCRILELGSGPGFLAEHLLSSNPSIEYVALDFSPAMHELALRRLGKLAQRVQFIERSFRETFWMDGLGKFDYVVTLQAVHELRHKRHAPVLHEQVRKILVPDGGYLVCDHFYGQDGMSNDQLYMSIEEQRFAIEHAGFRNVSEVLVKGSLVLHHAT